MKRKILAIFLFLLSIGTLANENDDFTHLDNLYKEKKFDLALIKSEEYLQKYPNSKYNNDLKDKLGKLYFLNKNYKKSIEIFKGLYINENKKSIKDGYAYYLARANANLDNEESMNFYLNNIDNKKIFNKTQYEAGVALLSVGNNEGAAKLFNQVITRKGDYSDEALFNLGVAKYNLNRYQESFNILNEYSQKNKDSNFEMITYLKGSSLYKNNNTDEAVKYFETLVDRDITSAYGKKSVLTLIEIYANKKDETRVSFYLDKLSGTEEYNAAMIMIGDLYVTKKDYQKAISYYNQSNNQNSPRLIYGEAYSLYKLERYKEALEKFEKLRDTDYYNQAIYHIFAIEYKLKNYQKIIDNRNIMKRVVVTQTDTDNINTIIANSAYQLGNYKLAKDYYGRLFAISTKKENLFRVILLDSQILDMEDLDNRFSQYNKLFPDDEEFKKDIYLYTGDAHFKAGNIERAENIYKNYLDNYSNLEILSSLISTLLEQKKYDEMEEYLSRVSEEDKLSYLRGIAAVGIGNYEEAENYFQKALSLSNDDEILKNKIYVNRVRNFFLWEKYSEAISAGENTLSAVDKNNSALYSEMLDKIAISYFRLGNYEAARRFYNQITEINGYEVYGKFQIADSYFNQKNYDIAENLYKEIYQNFEETYYGEQAYYKYITILQLKNDKENFEIEKNKFLTTYPDSKLKTALINLSANYYASSNDTEKALEALQTLNENSDDQDLKENNNLKIINLKLKNKEYAGLDKIIEELENTDEKAYYMSLYYQGIKKNDLAAKEYEKLTKSEKYKIYALENLGNYWYSKKDNVKAKANYTNLLKIKETKEYDYIIYRLALINEKNKDYKSALINYKKIYDKYKGKYEVDSLLKAADIYDSQENISEAKKLFFKLYKMKNTKEVREYTLEKLIYYRLVENNTVEAKKYYEELKKLNKNKSEKFVDYF